MPVGERRPEHSFKHKRVGEVAERAEGKRVLDVVVGERAGDAVLRVGAGVVAVLPGSKGALDLDIAEVIVPVELGDADSPRHADGRKENRTEADGKARADSGGEAAERNG